MGVCPPPIPVQPPRHCHQWGHSQDGGVGQGSPAVLQLSTVVLGTSARQRLWCPWEFRVGQCPCGHRCPWAVCHCLLCQGDARMEKVRHTGVVRAVALSCSCLGCSGGKEAFSKRFWVACVNQQHHSSAAVNSEMKTGSCRANSNKRPCGLGPVLQAGLVGRVWGSPCCGLWRVAGEEMECGWEQ